MNAPLEETRRPPLGGAASEEFTSSVTERQPAACSAGVKTRLDQAKLKFRAAKDAWDAGDVQEAARLLGEWQVLAGMRAR